MGNRAPPGEIPEALYKKDERVHIVNNGVPLGMEHYVYVIIADPRYIKSDPFDNPHEWFYDLMCGAIVNSRYENHLKLVFEPEIVEYLAREIAQGSDPWIQKHREHLPMGTSLSTNDLLRILEYDPGPKDDKKTGLRIYRAAEEAYKIQRSK